MQSTEWSIEYMQDWVHHEKMLMIYDEEEKQQNQINKEHAELLYSPEFIPLYLEEKKKYWFSLSEALIYGFIRFYMKNNKKRRFYFTDEHIWEILDIWHSMVSSAIKKMNDLWIVKKSQKMKAWGGTIRYITEFTINENEILQNPDFGVSKNHKIHFVYDNKNKIKDNKTENEILRKQYLNNLEEYFEKRNSAVLHWLKIQLPKNKKITEQMKNARFKLQEELNYEEIKEASNNYFTMLIKNWNDEDPKSYTNHRFSLEEFIWQSNWARKFINKQI